ncbi:hypothetical protein H0H92_011905, partial [Tricholoma furcatifolium]
PTTFSKSLALRSELQSSGVSLIDCPHNGRKDVADKMMLDLLAKASIVDMLAYAIDNPAPSTIILISGDRDFAYAVSVLRLRRYRVMIISLPTVHTSLRMQASTFVDWNDVLSTEIVNDCWSPHRGSSPFLEVNRPFFDSSKGLSSVISRGRQNNHNPEVDIMDYLRYRGNAPHLDNEYLARRLGKVANGLNAQDISLPATPPTLRSHEPKLSDVALSSQKDTAIAPSLTTTPNVLHRFGSPLGSHDEHIPEPISVQETTNTPSISRHQHQDLNLIPPLNDSSTNTSFFSQHSYQSPTLHPTSTTAPVSTESNSFISGPPLTEPKGVPLIFNLLVERLKLHRSKGFYRPLRSIVSAELVAQDKGLYRRAGAEKFGQYVALAEKAGIIELGGKEGGAWIALRPEWYNVTID